MLEGNARAQTIHSASVLACENLPVNQVDAARKAGATVEFVQGISMAFLCFNCQKEPFDDYRVRQAIHYAIDTDKLISETMGGNAQSAACILPRTHRAYHKASTVFSFDQDKSRELLSAAGHTNFSFTLLVKDN